jgi:phage terminase large subunit-like protein
MRKETRGERNIRFIETFCVIPEGEHVGKPVKLEQFQKDFLLAIYDNKHITDTAILSIARKNAKTGLIAFLVILHLVGPEAVQNSRIISGAMSREQAGEVYNLASKCIMLSERLSKIIKIIPSGKKLIGLVMNVEYQAISAEGKTAHGKSPIVAILDEVGQIRGPQSDFVDAITTAQGAYQNPLLIYISTQAANDADLFSILIDDAKKNKHPKTVCHVYAAPEDAEIMDEKAWKAANPAMGSFRSEADMRKQAEKAARMPSFENTFRNLNLNQRISTTSPFISRDAWKACSGDVVPIELCTELYGGLDLSGKLDLTAFVLYGLYEGAWNAYVWAWTPEKGLSDRAKRDRAPYDVWVREGYLLTTPNATIDYDFIAVEIAEICSDLNVTAIAYDRWRIDILKKEFERIGVDLPLVEFGQGFKDQSPAMDAIEGKIMNETLRHGGHPLLTMAAANTVVSRDPAGNRKPDKQKTTGRIDPMVALIMAAGIAEQRHEAQGNIDDFLSSPLILNT